MYGNLSSPASNTEFQIRLIALRQQKSTHTFNLRGVRSIVGDFDRAREKVFSPTILSLQDAVEDVATYVEGGDTEGAAETVSSSALPAPVNQEVQDDKDDPEAIAKVIEELEVFLVSQFKLGKSEALLQFVRFGKYGKTSKRKRTNLQLIRFSAVIAIGFRLM